LLSRTETLEGKRNDLFRTPLRKIINMKHPLAIMVLPAIEYKICKKNRT